MTTVKIKIHPRFDAWWNVMTAFTRVNAVLSPGDAGRDDHFPGVVLDPPDPRGVREGSMRPSDLADQIGLSRSATTRLVDRLEGSGLVERRACASDRRGSFVMLTPRGEEVFREAGRVHLRGIDEHVGSHLTNDELAQLSALLGKLADRVGGDALSTLTPPNAPEHSTTIVTVSLSPARNDHVCPGWFGSSRNRWGSTDA